MKRMRDLAFQAVKVSFFIVLYWGLVGCYSFTGSSLGPDMKTIQIKNFPNNAALVNVNLSQEFSVALQNRFLQRTTLKGTNDHPDLLVEGEIVDYNIVPTNISVGTNNISGNTVQANQNKLVITVKVRYQNRIEPQKNFEKSFTDEVVFASELDINTIETQQVKVVNERIINKIFNEIVANW